MRPSDAKEFSRTATFRRQAVLFGCKANRVASPSEENGWTKEEKVMKTARRMLLLAACTLTLGAGLALAGGNPKARQVRQQKRIAQGVRSGELTRAEARHMERRTARVHGSIVRDRIDGGVFTPRERLKAQHRLNHQSRAIYRQKHDGQFRK
jgi:hypothetical protein